MNEQPKIRIIAGPNGSGKTTFINEVRQKQFFHFHNYVNADDIELQFKKHNYFSFANFQFKTNATQFLTFVNSSGFKAKVEEKITVPIYELYEFVDSGIHLKTNQSNSYFFALVADFVRAQLLSNNLSFEYETVMSDYRKVEFLQEAKAKGYKIYLYFLCTENIQLNLKNVENRVLQGGHFVEPTKIKERYFKTLNNLLAAIKVADVAYIFQNNMKDFEDIFHKKNNQTIYQSPIPPQWFIHNYLNKL